EERAGQVPFTKVLTDLARAYKEEGPQIATGTARVLDQLKTLWHRDMRGAPDQISLDFGAIRIGQRFDMFFGGANGPTKFPSASLLEVLWRAYLRTNMPQFLQLTTVTLDNMLLGGMYDHVGGGFFRYSIDDRWILPNFEKTLNDNAALVEIMTSLWQFNRNNLCKSRVTETIEWMLRDMKVQDAFASGLDSDTDGEEGKYYVWSEAEVDAALKGTFLQKFKQAYNIQRDGHLRGKNVPYRISAVAPFPQSDADEALLAKQRELLLTARNQRTKPLRDDKVLADWNGLAISALAIAGAAFGRADWTTAAIKAFDFVVKTMGDGERLYHSWRDGKRGHAGFADDYAQMTRAALILFEKTSEKRFLDQARAWVRTLNTHFWDNDRGAYFFTPDDSDPLLIRTRMMFDQPSHSANGRMLEILARLFMITNEKEYSDRASQLIAAIAGEVQRAHISMGAVLSGFEYAVATLQIAVIGPQSNHKTQELVNAINGRTLPNMCLTVVEPDAGFPAGHPLHGKTMENGQPTAYISQRGAISQPITNPVNLSQILQLPRPMPVARPQ
ncbi:MAG TPA: hypothetical protein VGU69_07025, partial [Rhizomicrobium sp.]|nr:hypothetical protein [Rhizomicrobium sp.]